MSNTPEQLTENGSGDASKSDAYTPSYTLWTVAYFLLVWLRRDIDRIFNLYIVLVPLIVLPALGLATTLFISFGINALNRRWRRAISIVAAPIIAGSLFLLMARLGLTTEWLRLELGKSSYLAQIDALPAMDGGLRLKSWDWGEAGGVAVANTIWVLVYDEADQIALPQSSWSAEWLRKAEQAAKGNALYSVIHTETSVWRRVTHLDGHFYVAELVW
jgi:hypothetical protein